MRQISLFPSRILKSNICLTKSKSNYILKNAYLRLAFELEKLGCALFWPLDCGFPFDAKTDNDLSVDIGI